MFNRGGWRNRVLSATLKSGVLLVSDWMPAYAHIIFLPDGPRRASNMMISYRRTVSEVTVSLLPWYCGLVISHF